jgi:hypothetical protein
MKVSIADPVQEVSISACRCVNLANVNSQSSKAPDRQDLSLESGVAFWVAVQFLNWKLGQAQSGGSDISREWIQKPRQARVTATG